MDDITFNLVSGAFALGGFLGTAVGYKKLQETRRVQKLESMNEIDNINKAKDHLVDAASHITNRNFRHPQFSGTVNRTMLYVNDFTKVVGSLAMHSLYGSFVYPLAPLYALPGLIKRDAFIEPREVLVSDVNGTNRVERVERVDRINRA